MKTLVKKKEDLDVKSSKMAECQDTEATAVNYLELQEERHKFKQTQKKDRNTAEKR